jgi:hypothetical protein
VALFWSLLALVLVFAVAAAVIGREARRLAAQAPNPVFDLDEAVAWVAEHLPFDVTAVLSYDDVRQILDWHLAFLKTRGVSSNGTGPHVDGTVVVGGAETADYVLERTREAGLTYTPAQVHAVLDAQMRYLEAIGAVGPIAPDEGQA